MLRLLLLVLVGLVITSPIAAKADSEEDALAALTSADNQQGYAEWLLDDNAAYAQGGYRPESVGFYLNACVSAYQLMDPQDPDYVTVGNHIDVATTKLDLYTTLNGDAIQLWEDASWGLADAWRIYNGNWQGWWWIYDGARDNANAAYAVFGQSIDKSTDAGYALADGWAQILAAESLLGITY